jgi:hypothetical protein
MSTTGFLDARAPIIAEDHTPDTLELSLESGLGLLEALANLETIGFEGVDHRIGKLELEWMAKS